MGAARAVGRAMAQAKQDAITSGQVRDKTPGTPRMTRQEALAARWIPRGSTAMTGAAGPSKEVAVSARDNAIAQMNTTPPVNGSELMDFLYSMHHHYARWERAEWKVVAALWDAHTWFRRIDGTLAFEATPRFLAVAPPESGKTRIARIMRAMSYEPTPLVRGVVTAPGVRDALKEQKTLFLDEVHRLFGRGHRKEEVQAILTGGYTPDGGSLNGRGGYNPAEDFGPVMMCAQPALVTQTNGYLEDLFTRSFIIYPRTWTPEPGEAAIPDLDNQFAYRAGLAKEKLALWAAQYRSTGTLWPLNGVPESLSSRYREIAMPLLAVADRAVNPADTEDDESYYKWPRIARRAIELMLTGRGDPHEAAQKVRDELKDMGCDVDELNQL